VLKRTIVIGIARALIDNACHSWVEKATVSDLDFLLDRFIAEVTKEKTAHQTKVNETFYEHITRTMEADQAIAANFDKTKQLEAALCCATEQVLTKVHMFPALLGMEFVIHDNPLVRYASLFNSAYPDPLRKMQATLDWLGRNFRHRDPFVCMMALRPLDRCFNPLTVDGKKVLYDLTEDPQLARKTSELIVFLQLREFYRLLPRFLEFILGRSHSTISLLESQSVQRSLAYLQSVETIVGWFHNTAPANPYWAPNRFRLVPRTNLTIGDHLFLELL
jgi:hypothetical protein